MELPVERVPGADLVAVVGNITVAVFADLVDLHLVGAS